MPEDLEDTIRENASGPAKAVGDAGSVEQHKLAERSEQQLTLLDSLASDRIGPLDKEIAETRSQLRALAASANPLVMRMTELDGELAMLPGVEEKLLTLAGNANNRSDGQGAAINAAHGLKALRDRERRSVIDCGLALKDRDAKAADLKASLVDCGEVSELLALLARDSNRYVQQAAKQATKHQQSQRARRGRMQRRVDAVDTCIQELERPYDKQAVRSARKINSRLVELVVGAMVHDLRNVLTRLQANCYTVTRGYGARKNESRKVREDLRFLCSLLDSMDKYARPIDVAPEVVPLGDLLTAAIDQARATARNKAVEVDSITILNQAASGQSRRYPDPIVSRSRVLAKCAGHSGDGGAHSCSRKVAN